MISGRSLSAAWCRQVYPWPEYTFTSAPLLIRYLASSSQHTTNSSQVSLLLDELRVVPEHGVVEAGAVAAALVEDIDIRPLLHKQPGHLHTPVLPHTGYHPLSTPRLVTSMCPLARAWCRAVKVAS